MPGVPIKDYRLTGVQRAAILAKLPNLKSHPPWTQACAAFLKEIPKQESWRFITTGLLQTLGFTDVQLPRTWVLKGQLLILSALSDKIKLQSLLNVAYEATFEPDNEDKSSVLPIPDFESALANTISATKELAEAHAIPTGAYEPEPAADASSHEERIAQMCESMSLCASTMSTMMGQLMQKMPSKASKAMYEPDLDSDDPEEEEADYNRSIKLWREGIVTRVELIKAMDTYKYPLAPFIKRAASQLAQAMLLLKDERRVLDPEHFQSIMMLLSTALRDVEEEILEPGCRPAVQENHALAMSLLDSRYSKSQLNEKLRRKPKKQGNPQSSTQPSKKEEKKPQHWKAKKYPKAAGSASHDADDKSE